MRLPRIAIAALLAPACGIVAQLAPGGQSQGARPASASSVAAVAGRAPFTSLALGREPDRLHVMTKTAPDRNYATSSRNVVGHSEEGSPIALRQFGDRSIAGKLLIFGCVHGDECAASAVRPLSALTAGRPDPKSNVFVVPNLNPDGAARGTRTNGRGVDLNRNFPWRWQPLGSRGTQQYAGPRALSEPEARIAHSLIA
ncbi:MAG: hypothetical protein QOF23_510, partial [Solirubrobacterales bacterium]|nr:hypothetical protein [Solirubrobacterales bacterium]